MDDSSPNFELTLFEDQPIIIARGYHLEGGVLQVVSDLGTVLDQHLTAMDRPAYVIFDFSTLDVSFGEVMQAMSASTRSESPGSLRDPRIVQSIFVSANDLLAFSSKAFSQNQYGALDVPVFSTFDEALSYVQSRLATDSKRTP